VDLGSEMEGEDFCLGGQPFGGIARAARGIPISRVLTLGLGSMVLTGFPRLKPYGHLYVVDVEAGSKAASLSHIITLVWKSWASFKVRVFSWQLLLDRIHTRMNLLRRGVMRDQEVSLCVFCGVEVETVSRLFVTCGVGSRVWYEIF